MQRFQWWLILSPNSVRLSGNLLSPVSFIVQGITLLTRNYLWYCYVLTNTHSLLVLIYLSGRMGRALVCLEDLIRLSEHISVYCILVYYIIDVGILPNYIFQFRLESEDSISEVRIFCFRVELFSKIFC